MRLGPSLLSILAVAATAAAAHAAPSPSWARLADCAAAYQANARLSDPGRAASMTAQISDVANDYAKAAEHAWRKQAGRGRPAPARAVSARIARQTAVFARRPREEVERFIDACPQLEE